MNNVQSLAHSVWECKYHIVWYHIVWIPKWRRKVLYGRIRKYLGDVFRELARQRETQILQCHLCAGHVHMHISIPSKYAVAQVFGFIKGKSAIHIARTFGGRARNFVREPFWARGSYISTVGQDEKVIREYIKKHEAEDKRCEQLNPAGVAAFRRLQVCNTALSGSQFKPPARPGL